MIHTDGLGAGLENFAATIAHLRAPQGCPWDSEQTHASIARNMIEEAYEAVDAIELNDSAALCEELGDVLLQVVFHSQIAAEAGEFGLADVIEGVNKKMIRRHPHVFGDEAAFEAAAFSEERIAQIQAAKTAGQVLDLWNQIKLQEKEDKEALRAHAGTATPSLFEGVPKALPALMQAQDISRKAVAAGFEWESVADIWQQVDSEIDEFKAEATGSAEAHEEFGDILFSLVNVARREGIDAESALRAACEKFRRRWSMMEQYARDDNCRIESVDLAQQEAWWQAAKQQERAASHKEEHHEHYH
jgi:tetrapyrrole methylase family protein/MazG family protein